MPVWLRKLATHSAYSWHIGEIPGDLGKKILNIPEHHSSPMVALKWPTMRLRILHRKLGFLWCTLHPKKTSIYVNVFESLRALNH